MSLQGHTKIVLTDAATGRSRVVADQHNTLTGALADIYRPLGMFTNGNILLTDCCSIQSLFGGLLAFDRSITPENYSPPAEARIVAAGVYKTTNNGSNQVRGTYNTTESSIDYANKKATFVYDFATNQGNGTIGSICLTPLFGGYMNEAEAVTVNTGLPHMFLRNYYEANLNKTVYDNYGSASSNYERGAWGRLKPLHNFGRGVTGSGTATEWYNWRALEVDEESDTILIARLDWRYTDTALTLRLERYGARLKSASIWECYSGENGTPDATVINLGDMLHTGYSDTNGYICLVMNYDWERRKLWVVNPDCIKQEWSTSYGRNQRKLMPDGAIRIWEVDVDTGEFTQHDITNQTGVELGCTYQALPTDAGRYYLRFFVYDGWLYVVKFHYASGTVYVPLYRINIANPAKIERAQSTLTHNSEWLVSWAGAGRICFEDHYQDVLMTDTFTTNTIGYNEVQAGEWRIPIKGRPHMVALGSDRLVLRSNTLMTYNNITPIEKTAAQTMKIVYTISEA